MVDHQKYHDTIKKIDTCFSWGIRESSDFVQLCPQFKMIAEYNFTDGMKRFAPIRMAVLAPFLRNKNNHMVHFEQI